MRRAFLAALTTAVLTGEGAVLGADPVVAELSGSVIGEIRGFFDPPRFRGQRRHDASVVFEPELYIEWNNRTSLTAAPFLRADSADAKRSHSDIRELWLQIVGDDWELGLGVGKLFWGVTESVHLVDIINQTDLVENIDREDKLGQPMVDLTLVRDWGFIDAIYMPWFRERSFQGRAGRLRNALVIDRHLTGYESGAERWYPGLALRYGNSFGGWDLGIHQFHGIGREPRLLPRHGRSSVPVLAPFYEIIDQTGADVQYTSGGWLWKLEALFRRGQRDLRGEKRRYTAFVGGFEYTSYNPFETGADLGFLAEYLYDSRRNDATTAFESDVFIAGRLSFNDPRDTGLLVGVIQDLSGDARFFSLESSRRIGEGLRLTVEMRLFVDVASHDPLNDFRNDHFIQVSVGRYF